MNATIKSLALVATFAASLFATGTAHASNSCDLPVVDEVHALRVLSTHDFVQESGLEGFAGAIGDDIEIVPGLSGAPGTVSLRSVSNPNHYYALAANWMTYHVDVRPNDGTSTFADYATFAMEDGISTGLCNYTGVSFRLVAFGTSGTAQYLSVQTGTNRLMLQQSAAGNSNSLTTTLEGQTFAIDWEQDEPPVCE